MVPPDERYGPGGTVRPLVAYDAGLAATGAARRRARPPVQHLDVDDTIAAVVDRLAGRLVTRPARRAAARRARRCWAGSPSFDGEHVGAALAGQRRRRGPTRVGGRRVPRPTPGAGNATT